MANKSRSCSDGVSQVAERPHLLAESLLPHLAQGLSRATGAGFFD